MSDSLRWISGLMGVGGVVSIQRLMHDGPRTGGLTASSKLTVSECKSHTASAILAVLNCRSRVTSSKLTIINHHSNISSAIVAVLNCRSRATITEFMV